MTLKRLNNLHGIGSRVETVDGFAGNLTGVLFDPASTRTAAVVHFRKADPPWTFVIPWRVLKPTGFRGQLQATVNLSTIEASPVSARSRGTVDPEDWRALDEHYGILPS